MNKVLSWVEILLVLLVGSPSPRPVVVVEDWGWTSLSVWTDLSRSELKAIDGVTEILSYGANHYIVDWDQRYQKHEIQNAIKAVAMAKAKR